MAPIAAKHGVWIYDVEYIKEGPEYYLNIYIDKDGGVDIIDCENVSRALSDALDKEDLIPDAYILEVSSPGLGRVLKKDRHLEQSIGMDVELKLYKANEKGKDFAGVLVAFDADTITTKDPETEEETVWNRKDIAKINLALDF